MEDEQLGAIARFIAERHRDAARGGLAYTIALVADEATAEDVHAHCYEFAAAGIPYDRWPEMVMAALADERAGADTRLQRARRDSLAMSLVDYGENDSVSTERGSEA